MTLGFATGPQVFTAAQKAWGAIQPISRSQPPAVKNPAWERTPIDQFVLAKLEAKGLRPNAPAARIGAYLALSFPKPVNVIEPAPRTVADVARLPGLAAAIEPIKAVSSFRLLT